ncbi:hypothetical protein [Homoserinibacter sp. YIM 151385]|uniref:hypothetical protein n=1 Tax=Homoserinibacter sp. YIM 151385 TaxID=2985506 RepID=UPI0022F0544E|nr:hypothetical protein [Homoserinibacter sp. YIM 151385]WBU37597.1 hypothetical protein OF852_11850 [Homoserinibacter sp. YIM 151385]
MRIRITPLLVIGGAAWFLTQTESGRRVVDAVRRGVGEVARDPRTARAKATLRDAGEDGAELAKDLAGDARVAVRDGVRDGREKVGQLAQDAAAATSEAVERGADAVRSGADAVRSGAESAREAAGDAAAQVRSRLPKRDGDDAASGA